MEPAVAMREREVLKVERIDARRFGRASRSSGRSARCRHPRPTNAGSRAGVVSDGSYGVPRGLVFGFPLVTTDGQTWSIVDGLYLDETARARIAANVAELEYEAAVVSHLLRPI